jgi:hypothetical protein
MVHLDSYGSTVSSTIGGGKQHASDSIISILGTTIDGGGLLLHVKGDLGPGFIVAGVLPIMEHTTSNSSRQSHDVDPIDWH